MEPEKLERKGEVGGGANGERGGARGWSRWLKEGLSRWRRARAHGGGEDQNSARLWCLSGGLVSCADADRSRLTQISGSLRP